MPREAWPSAIASCFVSESGGSNSIPPSAFSGTATTTSLARERLARARVDLDAAAVLGDRSDRRREARLERRLGGDRLQRGSASRLGT